MVSMKDIARRCNVSVATVSKALNGYSDIGKAKREEIRAVAKEMGYFPNSFARALKTNRTYDLGILFADNLHSGLTHDYFAAILDAFKVTAESRGYDITFTSMNVVSNRKMSYYEHCRYRGLDGVMIANIDFTTPEILELVRSGLPVVAVDYVFEGRTAVVSDNRAGMRELVNYICSRGHKKIAYITGDDNAVTRDRLSSFREALIDHNIRIPDGYIKMSRYRDDIMTGKRTEELLQMEDRPTCIIFPDDYAALGGITVIRNTGMMIGRDISLVGYDGIPLSRALRLTTYCQDTRMIGRRAAEALIDQIENPEKEKPGVIMVAGKLSEGESVARI